MAAWSGTPVAASAAIPLMAADGVTGVNNAANYRQGFIGAFAAPAPGGPMSWRPGVIPTSWQGPNVFQDFLCTAGTGRTITVKGGNAIIVRSGLAGGPYLVNFNQTQTITADSSDTTYPRIDTVALQLNDVAIGDSGTQGGQLVIVNGTAAATPVAPTLAANQIGLFTFLRAANSDNTSTATFVDIRKSTGTLGGIRPLLSGDTRTDPGSYPGEMSFDPNGGGVRFWNGSAWRGLGDITMPRPTQSGFGGLANDAYKPLASQTIPDPGYPYLLTVGGSYTFIADHATNLIMNGYMTLDSTTPSTGVISRGQTPSWSAVSTNVQFCAIAPGTTGVLTGSHTVYLLAQAIGGAGISGSGGYGIQNGTLNWFCKVSPSWT